MTPDELRQLADQLEELARDPSATFAMPEDERIRLMNAAGNLFNPNSEERRQYFRARKREHKAMKVARDEAARTETGIRKLRAQSVFTTPNVFAPEGFEQQDVDDERAALIDPQHCYVCKKEFTDVHHFYDQMCRSCGDFNFAKRSETADLSGRVALLTGGRVKIGYQAGIKLLRAGAKVIVSTRFPRDAMQRYESEADYGDWADRIEVHGLDLRYTPDVEEFCALLLRAESRLDFIINNACQTVKRPPEFYAHMLENEHLLAGELADPDAGIRRLSRPVPEHGSELEFFPAGALDQDLQQIDLRDRNSWRLQMHEVSSVELLETQLVNAVAPFVLNARLKPLMQAVPTRDKHIVNVSAMEGQFYRRFKTTRHPHTNMAKAALNMMTRTSATDYHQDGIHMNSVDTGWVSDEDPVHIAEAKRAEHRFHPPLDIVDGAARIVDPIIDGFNTGTHAWGQFFKDYFPTDW